jgi:DNA (cytosine-5)-methyltransferase 1
MLTHDGGKTWNVIQEVFDSLNYTIKSKMLNAVDYGIPQKRKRLFVIGFKDPFYKFEFPKKIKLETTVSNYLEDFVNPQHYLGKKGFEFVTNTGDKIRGRSQVNQDIARTQIANQQFNWIGDFIFEKLDERHNDEILKRAYVGEYKNQKGVVRQLTHRECLRLMGFSDTFKMEAPNVQAYRQAGNSIVVNVLEAILDSIIETKVFSPKGKMKVATLFSGIGAFEYALNKMKIEHEVVFACDNGNRDINYDVDVELSKIKSMVSIDEKLNYVEELYRKNTKKKNYVQQSYEANYDVKYNRFFQDIKLLDGTDFKGKVDLLVGGSPCQSFSTVGFQQGLEDARGTLFYDYARIVQEVQPKVFIYENVRGLLTHDKGNTFDVIKGIFNSLGYKYYIDVLNSKDYGLPQNRRRLFVVGFKEDVDFEFPNTIELEATMQDYLQEQCKVGTLIYEDESIQYSNIKGKVDDKYFLSEKLYNYVMAGGTKTFYQKPIIDLPIARPILSTMGNRHRAGIDNYVTVDGKVRMLTEREAHRLMGFADDYKIVVSRAQAYKQAGNSIAVPVLIHLIRAILNTKVL